MTVPCEEEKTQIGAFCSRGHSIIEQERGSVTWEGLNPPYATIVADPPWRYNQPKGIITRGHRGASAEQRYSTMQSDDLAALPVAEIADGAAHCYLWTTNPKLRAAFDVLEGWGFEYVTTITWHKLGSPGMGFYFRGDTEHVLFGVRGKLPIAPADRQRNWFEAAKTGHSRKPAAFYDLVERVSPGPYVELFARQPRLGWDHWGYGYESSTSEFAREA